MNGKPARAVILVMLRTLVEGHAASRIDAGFLPWVPLHCVSLCSRVCLLLKAYKLRCVPMILQRFVEGHIDRLISVAVSWVAAT